MGCYSRPVPVGGSPRRPQLFFNKISRRKTSAVPALLGWLGRALNQVNVVGGCGIELKAVYIGAFERLGCGAQRGALRRRLNLYQLHQRRLVSAACQCSHHCPRIELDKRNVEDQMNDDREREQEGESAVAAGTGPQ